MTTSNEQSKSIHRRVVSENELRNAELLPYFTDDEKKRLLSIHQQQNNLSAEEEEIFQLAEARREKR